MKVSVYYNLCFDVEISDDGIHAIQEMDLENLDKGDAFNTYISEQSDEVRKALSLCSNGEIVAVYNADGDFDNETIWEA